MKETLTELIGECLQGILRTTLRVVSIIALIKYIRS